MGQAILRWFGAFYLIVGLLDFFVHDARGYEFGFLNVNVPHTVIHTLVGALWIAGSFDARAARLLGLSGVALFAILVLFGIFPGINPLQWWVPLDGSVLWFHVLTLLALAVVTATTRREPVAQIA